MSRTLAPRRGTACRRSIVGGFAALLLARTSAPVLVELELSGSALIEQSTDVGGGQAPEVLHCNSIFAFATGAPELYRTSPRSSGRSCCASLRICSTVAALASGGAGRCGGSVRTSGVPCRPSATASCARDSEAAPARSARRAISVRRRDSMRFRSTPAARPLRTRELTILTASSKRRIACSETSCCSSMRRVFQ